MCPAATSGYRSVDPAVLRWLVTGEVPSIQSGHLRCG